MLFFFLFFFVLTWEFPVGPGFFFFFFGFIIFFFVLIREFPVGTGILFFFFGPIGSSLLVLPFFLLFFCWVALKI